MIIHAGELREVLHVYPPGTTRDAAGAPVKGRGQGFKIRAKYKDVSLANQYKDGRDQVLANVQFVAYYNERVTVECQIEHQGTSYDIVSVQRFGNPHRGMIINCLTARRKAII